MKRQRKCGGEGSGIPGPCAEGNESTPGGKPDKNPNASKPDSPKPSKVRDRLALKGKIKEFAAKYSQRALTAAKELVSISVKLAPDILDTAEDIQKITFARHADSLREFTGVGTGVLANVASHAIARAIVFAKNKIRARSGKALDKNILDKSTVVLLKLFRGMAKDLGTDIAPTEDEIREALSKKLDKCYKCGGQC